jgi:curli biogenesis system outer membrane secretion channel CsgG
MRWHSSGLIYSIALLAFTAKGSAQGAPASPKPLQPFDKTGKILSISDKEIDLQTSESSASTQKLVFVRTPETQCDNVKVGVIVRVIYVLQGKEMVARSVTSHLSAPQSTRKLAEPLGVAQVETPSFIGTPPPATLPAAPPIRIAVLDFDVSPEAKSYYKRGFGTDDQLGTAAASSVSSTLIADGRTTVIDSSSLSKILQEQTLSNSDRAETAGLAKIGKLLGVDAVLVGSISDLETKDRKLPYGWALGSISGAALGSARLDKQRMMPLTEVHMSARLIDVNTGEIIWAGAASGESSRSGQLSPGNMTKASPKAKTGNDAQKALEEAGHSIARQLSAAPAVAALSSPRPSGALPSFSSDDGLSGTVLAMSDGTVTFYVPPGFPVKVGDTVNILRVSGALKDPKTGKVLKSVSEPVGAALVQEVDGTAAVAKLVQQTSSPVKVSDHVVLSPKK